MSVEINEKMTLSCKNIVLEVKNNSTYNAGKYIRLLNGITVDFKSGELNAIMGSSGGGKTTFINTIMGRIEPSSNTSGTIELSNNERDACDWLKNTAYLEQDDYIISNQTVKEFILFSTNCRRPDRSYKQNNQIVNDLINKLGLATAADVMLDSISGGERKRVMIAVEIAVEADIIILDEPTTGLDSHKAIQIIKMLKDYASEKNKIVIVTIHQPGSGLFEIFDKLLFINEGTKIYDGKAKDVEQWLLDKGLEKPKTLSKPEFLFELFCGDTTSYTEIKQGKHIVEKIITNANSEAYIAANYAVFKSYSNPFIDLKVSWRQSIEIFYRKLKLERRNNSIYKKLIFFYVISTFIISILNISLLLELNNMKKFLQISYVPFLAVSKIIKDKLGKDGIIILKCLLYLVMECFIVVHPLLFSGSVYQDKQAIVRELKNNLYSISSLIAGSIIYSTFYALLAMTPMILFLYYLKIDFFSTLISTTILIISFICGDTMKDIFAILDTNKILNKIFLLIQFYFLLFSRLSAVYDTIELAINMETKNDFSQFFVSATKFLLMLSPMYFLDAFLYRSLVLNSWGFDFTKNDYNYVIKYALITKLVDRINYGDIVRSVIYPKFYLFFSHIDSNFFELAMFGLGFMLYIFIQILLISYLFAPRVRMKL